MLKQMPKIFLQILCLSGYITYVHPDVQYYVSLKIISRLYRNLASELGFDEFHLYLRPVQFEVAEQKNQAEQRPVFITAILEDDSSVDR